MNKKIGATIKVVLTIVIIMLLPVNQGLKEMAGELLPLVIFSYYLVKPITDSKVSRTVLAMLLGAIFNVIFFPSTTDSYVSIILTLMSTALLSVSIGIYMLMSKVYPT